MFINSENIKRGKAVRFALSASVATFALTNSINSMAAEDDGIQLEEIIVTSTKRAVSVRDLPINISAVTGDMIEKLGVADITDLGNVVPGLVITDSGLRTGFVNSAITLRGLDVSNKFSFFVPPKTAAAVSIYVNDTPLFVNLQLMDISTVEVLRGPQGTLYGSGSLGGNIRYVMNKPDTEELSASITSGFSKTKSAGGLNSDTRIILNIPVNENFALRFNGSYSKEQGFVDYNNVFVREGSDRFNPSALPVLADPGDPVGSLAQTRTVKDADDGEALFFRAAALYETDDFSVNINYFHQELDADSSPLIPRSNADNQYSNNLGTLTPFTSNVDMVSMEVGVDVGFATLTSVTSYSDAKSRGLFDQTDAYTHFPFYRAVYGNSPRALVTEASLLNTETTTQEVRLVSPGDQRFDWIIGAFYQKQTNDAGSKQYYPGYTDYSNACFASGGGFGPPNCGFGTLFGIFPSNGPFELNEANKDLAYVSVFKDDFKDKAIFGELTLNVSEAWQITGGFRVFDQNYSVKQQGGLLFAPNGTAATNGNFSGTDSVFKANTSYKFGDQMVYATWSEGFRRGGANALGIFTTPETEIFKPDTVTNYEVGIKGIIEERFEYTLSYFYIDWKDIQANTTCSPLILLCTVDGGAANSQGIEAEFTAQISDNFRILGGYSYVDASLDAPSAFFLSNGPFGPVNPGVQLPGTPKHSGSATLLYSTELTNDLSLDANATVSYTGNIRGALRDSQNTTIKKATVVNASIAVSSEVWTVRLFAQNLFNETARVSQFVTDSPGASGLARRPRTVGLSVQLRM